MDNPKFTTVTRTQGNNEAVKNGIVTPRTFDFEFVEVDPLIAAFRLDRFATGHLIDKNGQGAVPNLH